MPREIDREGRSETKRGERIEKEKTRETEWDETAQREES